MRLARQNIENREANFNLHIQETISYIKTLYQPGWKDYIIIDVGCSTGGILLDFSNNFSNIAYGYEPYHAFYSEAVNACASYPQIIIKNTALYDHCGEGILHITKNGWSSSIMEINKNELSRKPAAEFRNLFDEIGTQKVRYSTLDQEFSDVTGILLIKLDTQGTELNIFKGGKNVLKKTKYILTEMNNHHLYKNNCQYYEVDEYLRNNGFKLIQIYVAYEDEYDALYENVNFN